MSIITNRRSFLFGASVAGFGIFAQGRRGWAGGVGPNETLNIACIGVGGKGESDTEHAAHHGRIVAMCDIDQKRLDAMAAQAQGSQEIQRLPRAARTSWTPRSTPSSCRRPTTRTPRPR